MGAAVRSIKEPKMKRERVKTSVFTATMKKASDWALFYLRRRILFNKYLDVFAIFIIDHVDDLVGGNQIDECDGGNGNDTLSLRESV